MTSLAFIFGLLPLWFASGSGAVVRRILGATVIRGMIAASGDSDLPDSGNVLRRRKVREPKEISGCAAIATSAICNATTRR
jgi:hypothetical protein